MNSRSPRFDQAFLERKRRQLMALRAQLQQAVKSGEAEEAAVKNESAGEAHEYEDDAQKLDRLETRGNLVNHDIDRLARVERALNKIEAGSYGFSDVSGEPIPDQRLEAMPEAINTVQEQEASERAG
jgi:RNA polymerase-binding transcription factor